MAVFDKPNDVAHDVSQHPAKSSKARSAGSPVFCGKPKSGAYPENRPLPLECHVSALARQSLHDKGNCQHPRVIHSAAFLSENLRKSDGGGFAMIRHQLHADCGLRTADCGLRLWQDWYGTGNRFYDILRVQCFTFRRSPLAFAAEISLKS
jgi:hypothetical protein